MRYLAILLMFYCSISIFCQVSTKQDFASKSYLQPKNWQHFAHFDSLRVDTIRIVNDIIYVDVFDYHHPQHPHNINGKLTIYTKDLGITWDTLHRPWLFDSLGNQLPYYKEMKGYFSHYNNTEYLSIGNQFYITDIIKGTYDKHIVPIESPKKSQESIQVSQLDSNKIFIVYSYDSDQNFVGQVEDILISRNSGKDWELVPDYKSKKANGIQTPIRSAKKLLDFNQSNTYRWYVTNLEFENNNLIYVKIMETKDDGISQSHIPENKIYTYNGFLNEDEHRSLVKAKVSNGETTWKSMWSNQRDTMNWVEQMYNTTIDKTINGDYTFATILNYNWFWQNRSTAFVGTNGDKRSGNFLTSFSDVFFTTNDGSTWDDIFHIDTNLYVSCVTNSVATIKITWVKEQASDDLWIQSNTFTSVQEFNPQQNDTSVLYTENDYISLPTLLDSIEEVSLFTLSGSGLLSRLNNTILGDVIRIHLPSYICNGVYVLSINSPVALHKYLMLINR